MGGVGGVGGSAGTQREESKPKRDNMGTNIAVRRFVFKCSSPLLSIHQFLFFLVLSIRLAPPTGCALPPQPVIVQQCVWEGGVLGWGWGHTLSSASYRSAVVLEAEPLPPAR